jgi:hypothetical protein
MGTPAGYDNRHMLHVCSNKILPSYLAEFLVARSKFQWRNIIASRL